MKERKRRVAQRFGAAAAYYDEHAVVQRKAARRLAERVRALPLPAMPQVLEIGCGTGYLTRLLAPAIDGDWRVTDIAPAMLADCERQCAAAGIRARYELMDGEYPTLPAESIDLVVSSLAVQWFEDLPGALARLACLLRPGGHLVFATLGSASFAEWRAAHAGLGLAAATPVYPDAARLARCLPTEFDVVVEEETIKEPMVSPLDFPRRLRLIGADTPAANTRPLSAGELRRVLRALAYSGADAIGYHVLYARATRPR